MIAPDSSSGGSDASKQIVPLPGGTRDLLPEEMTELRELSTQALAVIAAAGYGEVATPTLEYEETLRRGGAGLLESAYRLPDRDGQILAMRFDSTIPIARLAATRYADVDPPLRFSYLQHVYRAVEPKRAEQRQFLQLGVELLGAPAPTGDAEVIELLVKTLRAAGLGEFKVAVGDVAYFDDRLVAAGVDDEVRAGVLHELHTRDLVGAKRKLKTGELPDAERNELIELATSRGGRELIERAGAQRLIALDDLLAESGVRESVIYDLGLVRELDYYTGTVLEVYAPGSGFALGRGGRYDNLVAGFGREMTACGFALNVERLHLAQLAEQAGSA